MAKSPIVLLLKSCFSVFFYFILIDFKFLFDLLHFSIRDYLVVFELKPFEQNPKLYAPIFVLKALLLEKYLLPIKIPTKD